MTGGSRGQSAVLGIVLLIGIVAIGSIGLLVVAGEATSEIQHQSENDRVEQAFVELSTTLTTASSNDDVTHEIDLAAGESGAIAKEDTGWIRIESEGIEDINHTIGTIEYEGHDGTKIAYEAGGVFRETGDETRVVSGPPIHYESTTQTFTMPVTTVTGDERLGSGDVTISKYETNVHSEARIVEDESVNVVIKSEYWRGWKNYFQNQAGDTSVRGVEHLEGDAAKVTVRIGYFELEEAFGTGVAYSSEFGSQGNVPIGEEDYEKASFPELDEVIYEMVEDFENGEDVQNWDEVAGEETLADGAYFADEIYLEEDLAFDLSDGSVTLVVDGDIHLDSALTAKNWEDTDNELKIYTTGNLVIDHGEVYPETEKSGTNSERIQLYGTSETKVAFLEGGEPSFEGVIYVASDEWDADSHPIGGNHCGDGEYQVCARSNPNFTGALIANSVFFQGGEGSIDFEYDTGLEDADIDLYPEEYELPPQLTYLNIAHHEIEVRNK
ncbi:DUF7289 family protein [Natrononativus amylolyticus]|uniref:DUF7289 family protein n=1 Tax=Natrononativus amylolyticus TaxID=2963434 RepID=UPI0020CD4E90|nr:hypothetical protein [Natrononativus amylolyticus]